MGLTEDGRPGIETEPSWLPALTAVSGVLMPSSLLAHAPLPLPPHKVPSSLCPLEDPSLFVAEKRSSLSPIGQHVLGSAARACHGNRRLAGRVTGVSGRRQILWADTQLEMVDCLQCNQPQHTVCTATRDHMSVSSGLGSGCIRMQITHCPASAFLKFAGNWGRMADSALTCSCVNPE